MNTALSRLLNHRLFEPVIMALIIFNAIILALETSPTIMAFAGPLILALDKIVLGIFVVEIILRMFHDFRGFWRDPWRIFDFLVVAIAIVPTTGALSALRAFRILRVLRLVSAVPQMRRVVAGLLTALPGMGSIVALLGLIFFVFSVISTKLLGEAFPEWFGSLGASAYTLFQVMTLESWSMGIVRPVMEIFPMAWLLFVPFIILTAFAVLNLFIGVIVDAMQSENAENAHDEREAMKNESAAILEEVRALRAELAALKADR
ncbi:ion transporter [Boseongicola aestuarii]|uniref:Ion transport protein n=1 Tax=Boseongicola aestuarii TaxID=1470561 RepID=A0A238J2M1_9RHOB|nr:ion transporter [Boseongicola aestuarii]SMX24571.1 Ion transport protein [Boseongicola aestuarii]